MIIKSIPHKVRDFGRLIEYIDNEEKITSEMILYNFLSNDKEYIKNEFMDNSQLLRNRKGANYLYHDIISLEENKELDLKEQEKILLDLGNKYLNERFKGCLAYGKIHQDRKHLHLHLCISSNRVGESKRVYYSKKDYLKIKQKLEDYKIKEFQNLQEKVIYNKPYLKEGYNQKEFELKRRTRKPSHRETTRERLRDILINSATRNNLILELEKANLRIYRSKYKKVLKVKDLTKERHRGYELKPLGLYDEYMETKNRLTQKETIQDKLRANREEQDQEKQNIKLSQAEKLKNSRELESDERAEPKENLSIQDKLKALREQQENKPTQKYNLKPKIK